MSYRSPSSNKILVEDREVKPKILSKLIREAYKKKDLYAECEIQITRKDIFDSNTSIYLSSATYKELWDCYRNLFQSEDLHPYSKIHPFSLGHAFAEKLKEANFLATYILMETLTIGVIRPNRRKKPQKEFLEIVEHEN